jgi:2-polyprenyl-3-methyl-5-hydroxy-6-metoxy-1,4-benzoquinol methylase
MNDRDALVNDYWSSPKSVKVQRYLKQAKRYDALDPNLVEDARFLDTFVAPRYAGRSVLDFGAGPGRLVELWMRHGVHLTSADWSAAFFPVLARRSEQHGARALQLDIATDCIDERFDLVFSTQVLLHIHPTHIDAAMANIRKMAGADILLVTWQAETPFDAAACTKLQSFNHDYKALFERHGMHLQLDMSIQFKPTCRRGEVANKVYFLTVDA